EGAAFREAHLEGADLFEAHLEGAGLRDAHLEGADFERAVVDGATVVWTKYADKDTMFTGVGLDAARVEPGLKQLLQYNIRRKRWEEWYAQGPWWMFWLKLLKNISVRPFWWMCDYGRSTGRIIGSFLLLALIFAILYSSFPTWLSVRGGELNGFLHALYFSVVTMTTLGFGDIHANPASPCGQILLMLQVILGYVLLGALVTRFAVLFTAGGPAAKFSKTKPPPPED
ncbi:MAG: ion channel, partial [Planctomycetota bacterium]